MKNTIAKSKAVKKTSKFWFFIALAFVVFFWGIVVHPFEFPDEQSHMESVEFLRREGRMPIGEEKDMTEEMKLTQDYLGIFRNPQGQNKYTYHPEYRVDYTDNTVGKYEIDILALNKLAYQDEYVATESARYPILYYAYENLLTKRAHTSDIITRLFSMRLAGVFLAFILAYYLYRLGFLIFGKAIYARALTIMVMLMPMISFVTAGVNSDNLHNLLFTIVIYTGLKLILQGLTLSTSLTAITATTLDLYTKPQGAIALPILGLALLITIVQRKNWKLLFSSLVIVMVVVILSWSKLTPYLSLLSVSNPHNSSFLEFIRFSINKLATQNVVWFWGVFKWLGVVLPPVYWRLANRVVLISIFGFLVYLYKVFTKKKTLVALITSLYLLLVTCVYSFSIYWFDWIYTKTVGFSIGVQARYFYPVIAPIMSLILLGLLSLGNKKKHRKLIRFAIVLLFLWLQVGGLLTIIHSYYDLDNVSQFVRELSQYKPYWAKGNWWYVWGSSYFLSLLYLGYRTIFTRQSK